MNKFRSLYKKFQNTSINTRFTVVVIGITVIILLVNVFMFYNINVMINQIDEIYDSNIRLNSLSETIELVRSNMTGYLNTKSSDSMEGYYRYEQELTEGLEDLNTDVIGDTLRLAEKNIHNMTLSYLNLTDQAIEAKRGRNVEKYKEYYDESEELHKELSTYISSLNNEQFKENAESYEILSASLRYLEILCIVIFFIVAIAGIVIVSIICNNITTPLRSLAQAAEQVSGGDYEVELNSNGSTDEVGIVTDAFNTMVDSVQANMVKLRENLEKEQQMKEKELMMEAHLKDAQLKYLQAQINPHFLFNTLNAGAQLAMMEGADRAYEYIQQVAAFFRYNIKKNNDVVTLREEIAMVDTYIYILNVRFSGEIGYEKELDEKYLDTKIPSMSLQPIVENSVNYGIRDISYPGVITLSVYRKENDICVSIKDNGIGMSEEKIKEILSHQTVANESLSDSNGIGINNVMSRLELLYDTKHVMDIRSEGKDMGTETIIFLPIEES